MERTVSWSVQRRHSAARAGRCGVRGADSGRPRVDRGAPQTGRGLVRKCSALRRASSAVSPGRRPPRNADLRQFGVDLAWVTREGARETSRSSTQLLVSRLTTSRTSTANFAPRRLVRSATYLSLSCSHNAPADLRRFTNWAPRRPPSPCAVHSSLSRSMRAKPSDDGGASSARAARVLIRSAPELR